MHPVVRILSLGWLLVALAPVAGWAAPGQSFEDAARHWAFQPVRRPEVPTVRGTSRVLSPVDAFVLQRLEAAGLSYSPPADRRVVLRRLSYALTGLPPTHDEVAAFERDRSADAVRRVTERLLASPAYGERWGRHWLDVARYADTKDLVLLYGKDAVRPYAYTYRDYVIRAFNEDLPFDQFVEDQLAADLVERPGQPWRLAALGFLTLGRLFDNNVHDQIDDQIDTVTRGFQALTVSCARCHDHKYDAITMADYYGLYGVFSSVEQPYDLPLIEEPEHVAGGVEFERRLGKARDELEAHIDREFDRLTGVMRERVGDYLVRAATTRPDITETTQFALSLTPDDFRPTLVQRTRRFLEARLRPEDRVFGIWAELNDLSVDEFVAEAPKRLEARLARGGDNTHVVAVLRGAALVEKADVARAYAGMFSGRYRLWLQRTCGGEAYVLTRDDREILDVVEGEQGPIWFERRDTPDHMSRVEKDRYNGLVLNLDKVAAHAESAPPARAMVVRDLPRPRDPHIFVRGNPSRQGATVSRGFLRVLNGGDERAFTAGGSGRLEMARAITARSNPLTARVVVNRIWMHHFGEPLVKSPADFGTRSEPPENPELLDWLASEFMDSGWSWKHLQRVIVASAAFQQAGPGPGSSDAGLRADPDNRLLWHYPRRRLDLEAMRDGLLAASGRLDTTLGGRPVDVAGDAKNSRRTVYGLVDRQNLPSLFRAFDFAAPDQCVERRPRTTVPQQALFALNSPFAQEQARALAEWARATAGMDGADRVSAMFRRVFVRDPREAELQRALQFVRDIQWEAPDEFGAWEQFAQVLLASNEAVFLD